jgi:hypothetical protein
MAILITHAVKLYDGFAPTDGVVTINDDNTFVLAQLDATGQPGAPEMNVPLGSLVVRGRATRLTFSANGVRRSAEFSIVSQLARNYGGWAGDMGQAAGVIAGGVLAANSGVGPFVAALRKGGASVKYLSYGQRLARNIAIGVGFLVVLFGFFAIVAAFQH